MIQQEQHHGYGEGEKPVSPYRDCPMDELAVRGLIKAKAPPVAAEYVVGVADPEVPNGRVPTNTATIQWDASVAGQVKANIASLPATAVDATTLSIDQISVKGANIASASTTNLAAATGDFVHITGNATIVSFGTMPAGTCRKLVFDGTPTLTYNATSMILPGAADIVVAAGDTSEFISEGSGNWKCFSYWRAATVPP